MKQYSAERKEAILRQMMAPTNKLVSELAREHGISEQTLYTWRRNLKGQGVPVPDCATEPNRLWSWDIAWLVPHLQISAELPAQAI